MNIVVYKYFIQKWRPFGEVTIRTPHAPTSLVNPMVTYGGIWHCMVTYINVLYGNLSQCVIGTMYATFKEYAIAQYMHTMTIVSYRIRHICHRIFFLFNAFFSCVLFWVWYSWTMAQRTNKETVRKSLLINLSTPSKMPGFTFALPAGEGCPTGSKLCNVKGSVCEGCYGRGGCYMFPDAKRVRAENYDLVRQGYNWANDLIKYLTVAKQSEFRFHDTGDLQSVAYLCEVVRVAKACPDTKFWVPTKEYSIVREYVKAYGSFPSNLCVRVSAPMIGKPISETAASGLPTSTVGCNGMGFDCPVSNSKEKCDTFNCRACWDCSVRDINYRVHGMKAEKLARLRVIQ